MYIYKKRQGIWRFLYILDLYLFISRRYLLVFYYYIWFTVIVEGIAAFTARRAFLFITLITAPVLMFLNAFFFTWDRTGDVIFTVFNFAHPINACLRIMVTPVLIVTLVMFLQL